MKKLLLAVILLCMSCAYAADFPRTTDAVLDFTCMPSWATT